MYTASAGSALLDELAGAPTRWTLIGNQVVLSRFPALGNLDAWDGFRDKRSERERGLTGRARFAQPCHPPRICRAGRLG